MSKRAYEALSFNKPSDPRQMMTAKGSKAQWDGLENRSVTWEPGDTLYQEVVADHEMGIRVQQTLRRLGISHSIYRAICEHRWEAEYAERVYRKRVEVGSKNLKIAHRNYAALSPEEKAQRIQERFGGTCALESKFSDLLREEGYESLEMNRWQSLLIDGVQCPREADIKVAVGDGRKIVVLCDGEAFHGPKAIHGDPQVRIANDRATALAFFKLGYSVVRYSETEIHDGTAVEHFRGLMGKLSTHKKVYRNWHPAEEIME